MTQSRVYRIIVLIFMISLWNRPAMTQLHNYQTINPTKIDRFHFSDAEGKLHTLAEYKGKIVVLNFWATWCAPCLQEMSSLNNLANTFPKDKVAVITLCKEISLLDGAKQVFDNQNLKSLPLLFDHENEGAVCFGIKGLPSTFIINGQGDLIGKLQGATEWDHHEVVDLIQSYINGYAPTKPTAFQNVKTWLKETLKI